MRSSGIRGVSRTEFGMKHYPYQREICAVLSDDAELDVFTNYLKKSDTVDFGGHQVPHLTFRMRILYDDGILRTYLGEAFPKRPGDIFVSRDTYYFEVGKGHGHKGSFRVRVPGLEPWVKEMFNDNNCLTLQP